MSSDSHCSDKDSLQFLPHLGLHYSSQYSEAIVRLKLKAHEENIAQLLRELFFLGGFPVTELKRWMDDFKCSRWRKKCLP